MFPADATVGQMVERRHAARERIGMFVGQRERDAEAEMLGHRSHRGHEQQRVVARYLHRVPERRVRRARVDVVHPQHVGDEETVEQAAFPIAARGRSSSRAVRYSVERSRGWVQRPGDWWPTVFIVKALKRIMVFGS